MAGTFSQSEPTIVPQYTCPQAQVLQNLLENNLLGSVYGGDIQCSVPTT